MSASTKRSAWIFGGISAVGLIIGFVAASLAIATTQDDPGAFGRQGNQELLGVIYAAPYPHLRTAPDDAHPDGRTIAIASANGKRGVVEQAERFDGQTVIARGFIVRRGDGEMLQMSGIRVDGQRRPAIEAAPDAGPIALTAPVDLGRWRLAGEICDGQCVLGIMRPGRGLAHKACANLCIQGGVPPMFVTEAPVEGSQFMMLAAPDGGPLPEERLYDLVGAFVSLDGRLERRGDQLFFIVDLDTADVL